MTEEEERRRRPPADDHRLLRRTPETKLLNHDLTKQLEETKAKLEDAESRAMTVRGDAGQDAAGGASDDDASITKAATAAQGTHNKEQTDIIKRLEKEVNGLNTKTRVGGTRQFACRTGEGVTSIFTRCSCSADCWWWRSSWCWPRSSPE